MKTIIALILTQTVPAIVAVPQPNPELDLAHACLVQETRDWLAQQESNLVEEVRWRSAVAIAEACETKLDAAAQSTGAGGIENLVNHSNLTRRQQLRAEANYYVYRLIQEHFEAAL